MPDSSQLTAGKVYLVGAGPGDAGLITLRGVQCLGRAELVLYDYLANPELLRHAPDTAEVICLGRHGNDRIMGQEEINARMIAAAQAGRVVVRLKGGDPAIFGRAAEETAALQTAFVEYEIVPGVTAALAAGSYAGIHLTHRDQASAVALITGQEGDGKQTAAIDYAALARFPGTLVFYMGVTTADVWSQALVDAGKPPTTPVAIIRRCSWPDQLAIRCTLQSVPSTLRERHVRPPVIVIVGDVAGSAETTTWFTARPLFGQTVLVTRPSHQAATLGDLFQEQGAQVLYQPAIEIRPPADWQPVDAALGQLHEFDWLVFSSSNGVEFLLNRLLATGGDLRRLGDVRLAAIGPGTAGALADFHLNADLVPDEFRAESLAATLADKAAGSRFLLIRASRGREVLADELQAAGGHVRQVVVYQSVDVTRADDEIAAALDAGKLDWITVTSSAIARSLDNIFGRSLENAKLASISPVTSATLSELGHPPAVEAERYTMAGLVDAIARR